MVTTSSKLKDMSRTVHVSGFPSYVSAQLVKDFLENETGCGTIYALKIRKPKSNGPNPRAFAVVQFSTTKIAEIICSLSTSRQGLYYGSASLNVRKAERDIIPKPRTMMLSLNIKAIHFGCQVSAEKFKVLWRGVNVEVNFEFGLRKVEILLSHCDINYKLELAYESIWQILLRHPRNLYAKFLIIQVFAAPRIYEKLMCSSGGIYGDPDLNYFRDTPDDQWVRATDFTTSSCIGQSSAICLELPDNCLLSGIRENFHYYKEDKGRFFLENSSAFSQSSDLVPIVKPPQGIDVPYSILFKVNCLVQNGCLAGPTLDSAFYRLVNPQNTSIVHVECALEKLFHSKECCYEPVKWLTEQYKRYRASKSQPRPPAITLDNGLVYTRRIQVTPSKVYFCGPEINVSNRVLRHYDQFIDNFIRVSFVDEDWEKMRSTDLRRRAVSEDEDKRRTTIYKRILSTLRNGISIGDKKFEFLAFSSSQLRDNSAWMFASSNGHTAASIRAWMGDFHEIRNVAKYAARLGQSFSSSTETLTVGKDEIEIIPDVEIVWNGQKYVFSDGIGKISTEFARRVAKKCGITGPMPSSFQIRYGGYKGVVAVDPTSVRKLSLRRSMLKYASSNIKLDVLTWSKFQPCFLNRQIITLLSTLGIPDHVFERKQKEAVDQLDMILTDPLKARDALDFMTSGEHVHVLKEMLNCGYKPDVEPYLSMMLQTFRALKLLELRKKARIFVPNGRSLMGCLDETRTLEYGQVFLQVSHLGRAPSTHRANEMNRRTFVVEGKVIVAKNPCLHPGDVRVLKAVNIPALHHMVDCVVFPQKGTRPHPNECSGSDLDGDIYFVTWDRELVPPRQIDPMDYTPQPTISLDHDVTIEVCAYASGKFPVVKSTIDAEIYACTNTLEALKIFYLDKEEITLRTDCQAIISFFNKTAQNKPSRVRWLHFVDFITGTGVQIHFEHITGKDNVLADTLSRMVHYVLEDKADPHLVALMEQAMVETHGATQAIKVQLANHIHLLLQEGSVVPNSWHKAHAINCLTEEIQESSALNTIITLMPGRLLDSPERREREEMEAREEYEDQRVGIPRATRQRLERAAGGRRLPRTLTLRPITANPLMVRYHELVEKRTNNPAAQLLSELEADSDELQGIEEQIANAAVQAVRLFVTLLEQKRECCARDATNDNYWGDRLNDTTIHFARCLAAETALERLESDAESTRI